MGFAVALTGVAMLIASVLADWMWSRYGAPATFYAGAVFRLLALGALALSPAHGRLRDAAREE